VRGSKAREVTRRAAICGLFALAIAGAALAIVVAAVDGFSTRIGGIRLSAHGAIRPLLFALLTGAIATRLLAPDARARLAERSARVGARLPPWLAVVSAVVVLGVALACSTRSAGGSDTYGYVSQTRLWLRGDLHVHQPFAAVAPWPNPEWTFSPLGYRPGEGDTIVPTYAPGLPLLMAAAVKVGGPCAIFYVTPVCAAIVILLTYALGARLSGPVTGLAAAAIAATSPTIVFMSLWSMSDVPVTMFWTAAILLALRRAGPGSGALAGIAAGAAVAIRPNLAPLIVLPVIMLCASGPGRIRRSVAFGAGVFPFVLLVAIFNARLYGSPLQSGYGDTASLFSAANIGTNLLHFSRWLWETQGPLVFLCVMAPLAANRSERAMPRLLLLAFAAAVFACYLLYTPFDAWWYLRFVLPAFPVIFTLAADAVWLGTSRFGVKTRTAAMLVFALACMDWGVRISREQHVLDVGEGERKYADVGRFVARELPAGAVVITMQHSGSVRYYSDRITLRYDWLDPEWLDRSVAYLQARGFAPYILLEGFEIPRFRERFKTQRTIRALDAPPIATHPREVYLYAVEGSPVPAAAPVIPRTTGCK
jgi:dolichyl-phosphate-mannose-protein mannosyltransferase